MSEDQQQRRPAQLAAVASIYEEVDQLLVERDDLKTNVQSLEHQVTLASRRADLAEAENERLRRQVHQMKGEVNHHFRSAAESDNVIAAIAALVVERQRAKDIASERIDRRRQSTRPRQEQQMPEDDGEPVPQFLHKGPREHPTPPPASNLNRILNVIRTGAAASNSR